jgi:hypothetical protein
MRTGLGLLGRGLGEASRTTGARSPWWPDSRLRWPWPLRSPTRRVPRSAARDAGERSSREDHLFEMFDVSGAVMPEEANTYLVSAVRSARNGNGPKDAESVRNTLNIVTVDGRPEETFADGTASDREPGDLPGESGSCGSCGLATTAPWSTASLPPDITTRGNAGGCGGPGCPCWLSLPGASCSSSSCCW